MNSISLKEISKNIFSGLTPLRSNDSFWNNGSISWLKTEQLGQKYIYNTTEKISTKALEKTSIKLCPINTLSIAMYGEGRTRGSISIIKKEMVTNQACCNIVIDEKKADYEFVYYFLKTQYQQLRNLSSGVRKNLNSNDIKNFEIRLPREITTQQKIASILSALDKKIELNNKINQNLEAMAKTLYDYWFVQFDFPDKNGKPYKSSGGKMVYSEELKREIPEGWEVKSLGEVALIKKGTLITEKRADLKGKYKVVSAGVTHSYFHSEYNQEKFTITISASGANAGFVNFWRERFFACDCTTINGKSSTETFMILEFLKLRQKYIYKLARGSAQPHVYPKDISNLKIEISPKKLVEKFGKVVINLHEKIAINQNQNQKLTQLRDWLLPMLMNGQVKVR